MVILENPPDQTRAEGGPDPGSNAAEILPPPVAPGAPAQETPNPPFLPDEDLDQELVTIQAGHPWEALDLRHLWVYRELLYFLMWRDIKVRYKQTVIGVAWTVLQPLMTMMVFAVFFAGPARLPSEGIPYPLFAFAGLWESWQSEEGPLETCTILTTSANELLGNLHERMPVILDETDYETWLDPERTDPADVAELMRSYPAEQMCLEAVSPRVNSPAHDDPSCLLPAPEQKTLF